MKIRLAFMQGYLLVSGVVTLFLAVVIFYAINHALKTRQFGVLSSNRISEKDDPEAFSGFYFISVAGAAIVSFVGILLIATGLLY